MNFKKVISSLMAVSMLFSLTACDNKSESEKDTTTIAETTTTVATTDTKSPETTTTTADLKDQLLGQLTTVATMTTTTKKPETTTTTTTKKPVDVSTNSSKKLDVVGINGYSDLKSGDGITAAATVLGYYGISVEPIKLKEYADVHGTSAKVDGFTPSPWDVIVDEPIGPNALYYAKPIINMINNYLAEKGINNVKPKDVSGATLSELIANIDEGKPVIVWGTGTLKPAEDSISWILPNGDKFVAKAYSTVYTLIGYTEDEVVLIDCTGGIFNVSQETFMPMYESMYSQAILIE